MRLAILLPILLVLSYGQSMAQGAKQHQNEEIIEEASRFLSTTAESMAEIMHILFRKHGTPSAYIRGEEFSLAVFGGIRFGKGELITPDGKVQWVRWRGGTLGIEAGMSDSRVFTLIYNLKDTEDLFSRFVSSAEGGVFVFGGISVAVMHQGEEVVMAHMRAGRGIKIGVNIGSMKYRKW